MVASVCDGNSIIFADRYALRRQNSPRRPLPARNLTNCPSSVNVCTLWLPLSAITSKPSCETAIPAGLWNEPSSLPYLPNDRTNVPSEARKIMIRWFALSEKAMLPPLVNAIPPPPLQGFDNRLSLLPLWPCMPICLIKAVRSPSYASVNLGVSFISGLARNLSASCFLGSIFRGEYCARYSDSFGSKK